MRSPKLVIIAGPNGAGKSSAADQLIRGTLRVYEFVNADAIAHGLSAFDPEAVAFAAGRIMLQRLRALAEQRSDFAFETTLATRSYLPWLRQLAIEGYKTHLLYVHVDNVETCIQRVAARVAAGGHGIPEAVIRRRYSRSLSNFFRFYRHAVTQWRVYDNSAFPPRVLAQRARGSISVLAPATWARMEAVYDEASSSA